MNNTTNTTNSNNLENIYVPIIIIVGSIVCVCSIGLCVRACHFCCGYIRHNH